jgi:S-formylglutathione hydrolase FrmB
VLFAALGACSGEAQPTDAATGDIAADVTTNPCAGELGARERFSLHALYLTVGREATVTVRAIADRCAAITLPASSANASIANVDVASVTFDRGASSVTLTIRALAVGTTTVRVGEATLPVSVLADTVPACAMNTPAVEGRLAMGTTVRGAMGSPLAEASVSLPMAAREVSPLMVSLRCAADQVPAGYRAIGPALRFDPLNTKLLREIPFTVPINPALVPPGYELHVELAYTSPALRIPRVVPVADVRFSDDGKALSFRAPRLGTWQPVVRMNLGAERVRRRFTFHGILGVSMGAAGAGMIGSRNLDRFDFVAPLGGPTEWAYQGDYIRRFHLGGFCSAAERARDPMGCARASTERVPQVRDLYEQRQNFEAWNFPDGFDGQGGTFDRRSYIQLFRDLSRMFGNSLVPSGPTGVLPHGVPDSELQRSDAERCRTPVVVNDWFDAEYNPDGSLPAITFCDGTTLPGRRGVWDGTAGNFPMEVALAVDVNRNGRRDPGEPVLRQFQEPWRDHGTDGVPSSMEPGYNAATNPDPTGDDYDRQFNPAGTEGNFTYEMGEPYDDLGVDGVRCPAGRMCLHDLGEGNGRFDMTPGTRRFLDRNPRTLIAAASTEALTRTEYWLDGGVHDLFFFGTVANHLAGALVQRGQPLHYFNNFASLAAGRVPETEFPYTTVEWARVPSPVMLRYGDPDATQAELMAGDGAHVGTVPQVLNRLVSLLWWMQARWPGGDRALEPFSLRNDGANRCSTANFCTFDFRSERARRSGPVSVFLPPGYHDPANANKRYPVVYFLHGYGQEPKDLLGTGLLVGNYMVSRGLPSWQRPQKFIMVFPDGRCREGDGCLRGTFYTDSPVGNAQMETYFLDLYDFVDRTYRVRAPETLEVSR